MNSHVFFKTTDFKSVAYYQFRHFGLFYLGKLYHKRQSLSSCGLYSFFTSRSSSNDKFHRNYQTHFQPFLDDFHVGKTTHQACFVFGKKRLELLILSALDFESSVYANSTTYRLGLKGVEPSFSDRKSDLIPLQHRPIIKTVDGIWTHKLLNETFSVLPFELPLFTKLIVFFLMIK